MKVNYNKPFRRDKVENPPWRPRKHKYDCFRKKTTGNVFAGTNDFVKDYHHPKLTDKQIRGIIKDYFQAASVDIIRKNEIFTWPSLGKIFIGKYKPHPNNEYALINTDGYSFKFYFQKESNKGTLRHYDFSPSKSVNRKNKPDYGVSGLRRWIYKVIHDPTIKYDAIYVGTK